MIPKAKIKAILKRIFSQYKVCCGGHGLVVGCPTCGKKR